MLEPRLTQSRTEVARIDSLIRALDDLRHWTEAVEKRRPFRDVRQQRLAVSDARLRDEAWGHSLLAAHDLFQIDGLHAAWSDMAGGSA
ncbi:hypothetical protein [Rhizorhabdus sp. FW153]|uniref:hypothetical protein n=1 Tax=Rhizorhabdus sp. FW153 TaxID=3400216 RepID=UPI003CE9959F